jgi:hypothetical protein
VLYNLKVFRAPWLPHRGAVALNFVFVVVGWVLFRSTTIGQAGFMLQGMAGMRGLDLHALRTDPLALVVLAFAIALSFKIDTYDLRVTRRPVVAFGIALLLLVCVLRLATPSPFLYFQF